MSRLSKLKAKKDERTIKDLTKEELDKLTKPFQEGMRKLAEDGRRLFNYTTKRNIQPFMTNYYLRKIRDSQISKWASILMVILTALIFIISMALLFK